MHERGIMDGFAPLTGMDLIDKTDESGEHISPGLPEGTKNYLIDIDGTIGADIPNEEAHRMATAEAYPDAIETINGWHEEATGFASSQLGLRSTGKSPRRGWPTRASATTPC